MTEKDLAGGDASFIVATPEPEGKPIVGVGLPSPEYVPEARSFAWGCLYGHTKTVTILPITMMGQDPAQARNQMAAAFLEKGCEAVLFIDCDMLFPPSGLDRLFAHDLDIVAADYRKRAAPYGKVGWPLDGVTDPEGGLVERTALGLGFMLIRRRVFEKVPRPWFARIYSGETEANRGVMTEDYFFCLKAREAGFKVWCDLDVTKETMHIGLQPVPWIIPGVVEQPPPSLAPAAPNDTATEAAAERSRALNEELTSSAAA